jgi:hypothetical protein
MKNLIKFIAAVSLVIGLNSYATGAIGVNQPQSGVIAFTNAGVVSNVFSFPYAYQSVPVVKFFSDTTNATPLTNSAVTTTNFTLYIATSTNANIAWNSYIGTPRIQAATTVCFANVATNVAFPAPYAQIPVVVLTGGNTNINGNTVVTAVTTTNFTIQCNVNNTNQWMSFGISALPSTSASTAAGYNHVNY